MRMKVFAVLLVTLGCTQMLADLSGLQTLKGVAAASGISPAPKVFTAHQGFETFSSEFRVSVNDQTFNLTPERYRGIRGPYNRRNAYGAALAYGPLLSSNPATVAMFHAVSDYAFCSPGVVREELGLPQGSLHLEIFPRVAVPEHLPLSFEVTCDE